LLINDLSRFHCIKTRGGQAFLVKYLWDSSDIEYMFTNWLEQKWFDQSVLQKAASGTFQKELESVRQRYLKN
ncbi:MAG: hypothetical protein KZQ78_02650, partial [Candidatus Thiodiazotropha sp. (ex Ustalcina ferruginea)]|nr:hypothetical protein [Candidatus Thiodiazotropha sp. (ex Ustalcina ferruginea)]